MSPRRGRGGRAADAGAVSVPSQTSAGWAPDTDPVDEFRDHIWIGDTTSYSLRWEVDRYGRPVAFAVVQLAHDSDGPRRVAVYDACHSKGVHVHLYDCEGNEIDQHQLRPVRSYEELEDGFDYAVVRVVQDWQENERRSARGAQ